MNRSIKIITQGINWRDGQGVLQAFMEELLESFAREMDVILRRDSHTRRRACVAADQGGVSTLWEPTSQNLPTQLS